ncbi:MAG: transglycosylase SLT domain-containing protein [Flavobacteriales bacterium]
MSVLRKNFTFLILTFLFFPKSSNSQEHDIVDVWLSKDSVTHLLISDNRIYNEGWHMLAQPNFWKQVMRLSPDSCIVNIAHNRTVLGFEDFLMWQKKTEAQKQVYKDSVRKAHNLTDSTRIFITSGKNHFYSFDKVIPSIGKAVEVFNNMGADPWYAQAILLIESPNKLQYSNVGAYGPFQLMKEVAKTYGLKVNKEIDEREDFDKSATAAAKLIERVCVPEAKRILNKHNITYNRYDLWFRLIVLHIYHAGSGNVEGVINVIKPTEGGMELIRQMWVNEYGGFKNASQNYSQVALASILSLYEIITERCEAMHYCPAP